MAEPKEKKDGEEIAAVPEIPSDMPSIPGDMFSRQELEVISRLLYSGTFGLSYEQSQRTLMPIINKIAKMIDEKK